MIVDYDGKSYEFSMDELTLEQAQKIKRVLGLTPLKVETGLMEADPDALQAVFWLMNQQNGATNIQLERVRFKPIPLANALYDAMKAKAGKEEEAAAKSGASRSRAPKGQ